MSDWHFTFQEEHVRGLMLLSGFGSDLKLHRLENKYWPDTYTEERRMSPWWLVMTEFGPIEIGWRKRVISIHWGDTPFRGELTKDEVTKDDTYVHAWGYAKAIEYLSALHLELRRAARGETRP